MKYSNYDIFNHWKDKKIKDMYILIDFNEPSCWGCGKPINENFFSEDVVLTWEKTKGKLERCHIIPKALGGKDELDNLFLLCKKCHKLSPDTTDKNAFLIWVYNKRRSSLMGYDFKGTIDSFKLALESFDIKEEDFIKYYNEFEKTINMNELFTDQVNVHLGELQLSSMTYLVASKLNDFIKSKKILPV